MAGKFKKLKIKKLQINFTNRWLYTLIVFFSLVVIGVFVYAYGTNDPATFGHSAGELEAPSGCSADQFLKWTGSSWTCADVEAGTETDPLWTGASTNVAFINKANAFGAFTQSFDTNVLFVDATNDRIGIGTTSPAYTLDVTGTGRFTGALTAATIDTGNGAKEVNSIAAYLGNQDLRTTDSPTFGGATINGIFSLGVPTTLEISLNNAITVTRSWHKLGANDDRETDWLETINGGEVGMILVLQSTPREDITVKHRTGNLYLDSHNDCLLAAPVDKIVLLRTSENSWVELSRTLGFE
jgi:hypothetical protein